MSFGFGVGDIASAAQLAWVVYKACKDAPVSFENIAADALSLHAVLKETDEEFAPQHLSIEKKNRLATILSGCNGVLKDIQALLAEYESLGTQRKRLWDRFTFRPQDASELRGRLTAHVAMLSDFKTTNSQLRLEKKLDQLAKEFRSGKRGSVMSVQTVDSLTLDDRQAWREIRKELESIGITIAAFEANKAFIFQWFEEARVNGKFDEEQPPMFGTASALPSDKTTAQAVITASVPDTKPSNPALQHVQSYQKPSSNGDQTVTYYNNVPARETRIPRVAKLMSRFSRQQKRLMIAVEAGDYETAASLFEKTDVNQSLKGSLQTALFSAIEDRRVQMARLLLDNGASLFEKDPDGRTALHYAARHGTSMLVGDLIRDGAVVDATDAKQRTPLIYTFPVADQIGSAKRRALLQSGANPNHRNMDGRTPLHIAAVSPHARLTEDLLAYEAAVDAQDDEGATALLIATFMGNTNVMHLLIAAGANVNHCNSRGNPLIHRVLNFDCKDSRGALYLVDQLAFDIHDRNSSGQTALHRAASAHSSRFLDVMRILLAKGAEINAKDHDYNTPLHFARGRSFDFLLEEGADPTAVNRDGKTPRQLRNERWERRRALEKSSGESSNDSES